MEKASFLRQGRPPFLFFSRNAGMYVKTAGRHYSGLFRVFSSRSRMFGIHSMYSGIRVASRWNGLSGLFRFFSTPGTLASLFFVALFVFSASISSFLFFNFQLDKSIKLSHCFHSAVTTSYATALS